MGNLSENRTQDGRRERRFIDQSQSLNIHIAEPNYGKLTRYALHGWKQVGGGSQPTWNILELEQSFILATY